MYIDMAKVRLCYASYSISGKNISLTIVLGMHLIIFGFLV